MRCGIEFLITGGAEEGAAFECYPQVPWFVLTSCSLKVFAGLGEKVLEYLIIMMTTIPGDPWWGLAMF